MDEAAILEKIAQLTDQVTLLQNTVKAAETQWDMDAIFTTVIMCLLGLSTVFFVAKSIGFLPPSWQKRLRMNDSAAIFEILKGFGIDHERYKDICVSVEVPHKLKTETLYKEVKEKLEERSQTGDFTLDKTGLKNGKKYIDWQGLTVDPELCRWSAEVLAIHMKLELQKNIQVFSQPTFDYVVSPKNGSPLLGYEFAKLMNKPFLLYCEREKMHTSLNSERERILSQKFDYLHAPKEREVALIVDDSATGGNRVAEIATIMRSAGVIVADCLVIFEPNIGSAREVLNRKNVNLHTLFKTIHD